MLEYLFFRRWELQLRKHGQESQVMKFFSRVNKYLKNSIHVRNSLVFLTLLVCFVVFAGRFPYYPREHLINHSPRYSQRLFFGIAFENYDVLSRFCRV